MADAFTFTPIKPKVDLTRHRGPRTVILPSHAWGGGIVCLIVLTLAAAVWVGSPGLRIVSIAMVAFVLSAPYAIFKHERLAENDVIFFAGGGKALIHAYRGEGDFWFLRGIEFTKSSLGFQALQLDPKDFYAYSKDGLKVEIELGVAYMVTPPVLGGDDQDEGVRTFWKMGSVDFVKNMLAIPQTKMAVREVIGKQAAFVAMTSQREQVRTAMEARIREQFALNKLTLLAVVLGDVRVEKSFYDEFVKSMATSVSNLVISPSLSPGVLELGRIHALQNAAVIYVPNTPALTIHPGEPPI